MTAIRHLTAWTRGALATAAFFALAGSWASGQTDEERPEWNQPAPAFRILGNIHYVGTN